MKISILLLAISSAVIESTQCATLRRKPKVYNALITTDQNLTPSRAFPVIQPHLQETYAYPSYSYRSYAPLGLYNNGFPYGPASYNRFHGYPRVSPALVGARNFYSRDEIHATLPPIANDFGLPPSLVPINSFAFGNLAPHTYSSYPIVYDQFGGYSGYLPPYPFYPPGFDEIHSGKGNKDGDGNGSADGSNGVSGNEPSDDDSDNESSGGDSSGSSGANSNGSSGANSNGSAGDKSNGPSGDKSNGSSGDKSNGSSGDKSNGSSGDKSGASGGTSGGSSGGGGSSSSSSTNTSAKSSRLQSSAKPEHPQQQSLNENIKNFPNRDPTIPDINPSPPVRVKPLNK